MLPIVRDRFNIATDLHKTQLNNMEYQVTGKKSDYKVDLGARHAIVKRSTLIDFLVFMPWHVTNTRGCIFMTCALSIIRFIIGCWLITEPFIPCHEKKG